MSDEAMNDPVAGDRELHAPPAERRRRLKWLYVRVLTVQALTLVVLWLLQSSFGGR